MTRPELIKSAERLVIYAQRVRNGLQSLSRRDHQQALADLAETHEAARRLFNAVEIFLKNSPPDATPD